MPVKTIAAIETSVVDLNYKKDGGSQIYTHEFISTMPQIAASVGYDKITDAPRKGDMVMIPAEVLDDMCVNFAAYNGLLENQDPHFHFKTHQEKAKIIRTQVFGASTMHAGGSLANTADSMLYSKIDGRALYDGNFVCTVGADEAGEYFKKSFEGHIRCIQGGRQMVSHIIPVDGDRIMITSPSFEDPSDKYFSMDLLDNELLDKADIIMVGGYLKFAGQLDNVLTRLVERNYKKTPTFVFTLAAQAIAEDCNPLVLREVGDLVIHGNTGEFRRHMVMGPDREWRVRFEHNFVGRDGKPLQGRELEAVKNANVDYINAKQAANDAASIAAYNNIISDMGTSLSYVVTNGSKPARAITSDGISMLPNLPIDKALVKSTVGAGDNHVAGYWIGKALGKDELGCLELASRFARAVIQIPEARLPRDAKNAQYSGPIAAIV